MLANTFDRLDARIAGWMASHGTFFLRISLGVVFIWFGLLKTLHASLAGDLVAHTVYWVDPAWFVPFLG